MGGRTPRVAHLTALLAILDAGADTAAWDRLAPLIQRLAATVPGATLRDQPFDGMRVRTAVQGELSLIADPDQAERAEAARRLSALEPRAQLFGVAA